MRSTGLTEESKAKEHLVSGPCKGHDDNQMYLDAAGEATCSLGQGKGKNIVSGLNSNRSNGH